MSTHDLRRKVLQHTDLLRRHAAHEELTKEENDELKRGLSVEEYKPIIDAIRDERRSAAPSRKVREKVEKVAKAKAISEPVDLDSLLPE